MHIRRPAASAKTTVRLASAVCLAALAAGCSSGVSRFDEGLFTGTVPEGVPNTVPPSPVSQPYPGDRSAQTGSYDRTQTGSVPSSARLAPPTNARPTYQRPTGTGYQQQTQGYRTQPVSAPQTVQRQPLRSAPAVEPPAKQVRLAPVPDATTPARQPQTAPVSAPQSVPTPKTASRNAPAPTRVAQPAATPKNVDPMITGTNPAKNAAVRPNGNANGWTAAGGTRVTIAEGETIYNLSRRYGVPAREILKANGISDASRIKTGQVVTIPTYVYSRKAPVSAPDNHPQTRAARSSTGYEGQADPNNIPVPTPAPSRQFAVLPSAPATRQADSQRKPTNVAAATVTPVTKEPAKQPVRQAAPTQTTSAGSIYTVQSGDTLSRIASRSGVSVSALKKANGLDKSVIRIGQKLSIPAGGVGVDTVKTASVPKKTTPAKPSVQPQRTASVAEKSKVEANAPKATGISKLRWPAKGQVMNQFGSNNDGIDISLPNGTPVKAAENGVVIYSGDGLKEYGNTVLVRHDNGLVSVYGHASELVVKRGDNVSRGQVVALSGMSGQANRPKLHFEIRKDAKPVDPLGYLE